MQREGQVKRPWGCFLSGKLQEPARSVIQRQKGSTWPGVEGLRGHHCIINILAFIWDKV